MGAHKKARRTTPALAVVAMFRASLWFGLLLGIFFLWADVALAVKERPLSLQEDTTSSSKEASLLGKTSGILSPLPDEHGPLKHLKHHHSVN